MHGTDRASAREIIGEHEVVAAETKTSDDNKASSTMKRERSVEQRTCIAARSAIEGIVVADRGREDDRCAALLLSQVGSVSHI